MTKTMIENLDDYDAAVLALPDAPPRRSLDADIVSCDIAVADLTYNYPKSDDELFHGLSHAFHRRELTALTGESGSGKSTLLYLLGLLLTPTGGSVTVEGKKASSLTDRARSIIRAHSIGFVFQDSELDPSRTIMDSVIESALYAGRSRRDVRERARGLLEEFGLSHRATHKPSEISGGQAQRIAVCRAMMNDPRIILADEPTGNLDRGNASKVLDALRQAAAHGRTVVIATHDPFVADGCDQVVTL